MDNPTLRFIKRGVPFFSIVGGGVFMLYFFQKVRYDFRQQSLNKSEFSQVKKELAEAGLSIRDKVTVEEIYNEILDIDVDNWQNIRGPRPYEDNKEYFNAKQKQQAEASERRQKLKNILP